MTALIIECIYQGLYKFHTEPIESCMKFNYIVLINGMKTLFDYWLTCHAEWFSNVQDVVHAIQ